MFRYGNRAATATLLVICVALPALAGHCPEIVVHKEKSRRNFPYNVKVTINCDTNEATVEIDHEDAVGFCGTATVNGHNYSVAGGEGYTTVNVTLQRGPNSMTMALSEVSIPGGVTRKTIEAEI